MSVETQHRPCPQCGAALRPDAPWCTLCYADLRPKAREPEPEPVVVAAPDPLTDPLPTLAPVAAPSSTPTWPCTACGATNAVERDTCAGCGLPFLAGLRDAEGPLLELPVVGDLTKMSRAQRFGLAGGVVLAFVVVTLLLGLLLS